MVESARITLASTNVTNVDRVSSEIREICRVTRVGMSGPVPLPTQRLRVPVRKGPDGGGTSTIDHWEMRIHKRLIDIDADDRALRKIMRIQVPDGVNIEIVLTA